MAPEPKQEPQILFNNDHVFVGVSAKRIENADVL